MTETVVSSKVLGGSDPISRKIRSVKSAFSGIGCGFVLLIIGFVLVYNSIYGVKEYSKIIAALPLKTSTEATANEELVKLTRNATTNASRALTYTKCADKTCNPFYTTIQKTDNVLYYEYEKQRFEIVKHTRQETRTKNVGGSDVEETVEITEYKEEWKTLESGNGFGGFNIGNIKVELNKDARLMFDKSSLEIENVKIDNAEAMNNYGQVPGPQVGSTKLVFRAIPVINDVTTLVVGKVQNSVIRSGDPFIVTTSSNDKLIADLGQEENFQRIALMIGAWLCMFIGLGMLLAPILELVNWIPLFGGAAKFVAGVISFSVATGIVLGGYLIMRFWYVFIILFVGLIILAVVLVTKKKPATAQTEKSAPATK